jgi:hypothetical protein
MNIQLVRLHLDSRQTRTALLLITVAAALFPATRSWNQGTGMFAQLVVLLITVAAAAVTAASTRNPFGEAERTASSPLPTLRLAHLLTLATTATATFTLAAATLGLDTGLVLRNLAGLTGIALLTAVLLGAHLAWTVPLGYVVYCGGALDLNQVSRWTWPVLPASDHGTILIALALLAAGVAALAAAGPRDRQTDPQ